MRARWMASIGMLAVGMAAMIGHAAESVPGVKVNVKEFGAVGDGKARETRAIQMAIERCSVLGGGEVIVPAGTYLTGAVALRSGVTLRLEKDAVVQGSNELADYPVMQVRWEGKWIPGHVGLIYAVDAEKIGIAGPGKIVGGAVGGRPTGQSPERRPALIEPINCRGVRFEGFSTEYRSMWCIHPTYCADVTAKGLTIRSTGGNGDGIDVDSSRHVVIEGCDIATGDDCVAIKSGRGMEAFTIARPTEDVVIRDCTMADSIFACIGIGSETSGGIRNVRIERCKFTHAQTYAIYIKSRPGRGAFIEDISVSDVEAAGMAQGFLRINLLSSGIQDQAPVAGEEGIPSAKNFRFSNVKVMDAPVLVEGTGVHPAKPLVGFAMMNVTGTCKKGILLANMKNVELRDLKVTGFEGPMVGISNVTGTELEGAAEIPAPKVGDPVPAAAQMYELK